MVYTFDILNIGCLFDLTEFIGQNIKGLQRRVSNIYELENQSLRQRINTFVTSLFNCCNVHNFEILLVVLITIEKNTF